MSETTDTGAVAVSLSLEGPEAEAFERVAKALPDFAKRVGDLSAGLSLLSEDVVLIDTTKADQDSQLMGVDARSMADDLRLIAAKVKDQKIKERLEKISSQIESVLSKGDLSTSDLSVEGGALKPEQSAKFTVTLKDGKYVVLDSSGKVVSTHDSKEAAQAEADRRNGVSKSIETHEVKVLKLSETTGTKKDKTEERTVLGVVLEPEVVDAQNDLESAEEIRKTAFRFMERYQQFGLMHKQIVQTVLPLESYLAPVDFEINGQKVKKGSWIMRVRVLDDTIWKKIKKGELTGFSIGGSAIRTPEKNAA